MNIETTHVSTGFYKPVSFAACSYLHPKNNIRRWMISKTLSTWHELLDLPFTERIFLDDKESGFYCIQIVPKTQSSR
jgi:hypothetical protein